MPEKNLIYIAGPLFTVHQRYFLEDIGEIVENSGFRVYLPHAENNERELNLAYDEKRKKDIFDNDVNTLLLSKAVIALLDGADVDSGTAFEIGMAYAFKKPVLGIRTDMRLFMDNMPVNIMIEQACNDIIYINDSNLGEMDKFIKAFLNEIL